MKKIRVQSVKSGDKSSHYIKRKRHSVYLGNGVTVYFSDIKAANSYMVTVNEFLNQKLFELNALYIDLFTEYRKAWFYFFQVYDKRMHVIGENHIILHIGAIEKKLTLMVARSHFENGSSIVWQGFKIINESMLKITGGLIQLYKNKKHYAQSHQIRSIQARIKNLEAEMQNFGLDMPEIEIYDI